MLIVPSYVVVFVVIVFVSVIASVCAHINNTKGSVRWCNQGYLDLGMRLKTQTVAQCSMFADAVFGVRASFDEDGALRVIDDQQKELFTTSSYGRNEQYTLTLTQEGSLVIEHVLTKAVLWQSMLPDDAVYHGLSIGEGMWEARIEDIGQLVVMHIPSNMVIWSSAKDGVVRKNLTDNDSF
jgi:hypothetical protein